VRSRVPVQVVHPLAATVAQDKGRVGFVALPEVPGLAAESKALMGRSGD
jgi:hypothetical protein